MYFLLQILLVFERKCTKAKSTLQWEAIKSYFVDEKVTFLIQIQKIWSGSYAFKMGRINDASNPLI